jgi:hypothetical protein
MGMVGFVQARVAEGGATAPGRRHLVAVAAVLALLAGLLALPATPAAAEDGPEWLGAMNAARGDAGLGMVTARDDWTRPAVESSRYMILNQLLTHYPDESLPGYTDGAYWAASTGNLYASSWQATETEAIDGWLDSPGHAYWVLHPNLSEAGYGSYDDPLGAVWRFAATLPVVDGVDHSAPWPERFTYPGDGAQVGRQAKSLYVFGAELPGGAYTVAVTVDGVSVDVDVSRRSDRQLVLALGERLPLDAAVTVEVRRDGEVFEAFSFTTSSDGSGDPLPPPSDGSVTGSVTDAEGGDPIQGATVTVGGASTTTGADGGYLLDGIEAGTHTLTAEADGYQPASQTVTVVAAVPLVVDVTLTAVDGDADEGDPSPLTFPDVGPTHPHREAISWMATRGITRGYPDGTFRPGHPVERGAMSAFMYRLAGEPDGPFASPDFPDVPRNHPHRDAIAWMAQEGITLGYPDGSFRPGDAVQRGAMSSFMFRMAGEPDGPFTSADFRDVTARNPHHDAIAWMAQEGITVGYPDGSFRPGDAVLRGAMSAFMFRMAS